MSTFIVGTIGVVLCVLSSFFFAATGMNVERNDRSVASVALLIGALLLAFGLILVRIA